MEEGVAFIKAGLSGGLLPDGSWVNVPPVQRPIPLVLGGLVEAAIDRAARLADGHFAYSFSEPEASLTKMYEDHIAPALERHGRSATNFHLMFASVVWASDEPERDWRESVGPAFVYQQRKYEEWENGVATAGGYAFAKDPEKLRRGLFVGRSEEVAERLLRLRERYPFDEVVFWARLPGVPFEMAIEQLERLSAEVLPRVRDA
jgi:alkanesulfonate monooxygenase SsuD/methylene tetrahydromethanopterin reductase-like flavin-dependent oxidoreductase (luciferase family)